MDRRSFLATGLASAGGAALLGLTAEAAPAQAEATGAQPAATAPDIVIADFESETWGAWTTTGTAFGTGPVRGYQAIAHLLKFGYHGNGLATSDSLAGELNDTLVGTLTSPMFTIQRRYIAFGIGGGDYEHMTCMDLVVDGEVVKSATGRESDTLLPQSWDVSAYEGKSAYIQLVDKANGQGWGHIVVDHIVQTDKPEQLPVATQTLYHETYRPQFHFTARQWTMDRLNPVALQEGWMNDLNGLIYYDGEYHLFAQRWFKCWIHAVSTDLIHWTELQPAFYEESINSGAMSGTCVIDYANTSGLSSSRANPPMVAFWSRADNYSQCIAYSLDHGRTWTKYANNPVLQHAERDPDVFWYEPAGHWVMVLSDNGGYDFFTSPNLLDWTNTNNRIPNSYECPNFFAIPLDGSASQIKWVMVRGNGYYSVGSFDGYKFTEETDQFPSDAGPNFYATQTWANTGTGDGRIIQSAWMRGGADPFGVIRSGPYPNMPFNQQAAFPRELTLRSTPAGPRLFREPIREITKLHGPEHRPTPRTLKSGDTWNLQIPGDTFHVTMNVSIPSGATLTFDINGVPLVLTHDSIACGTDPQTVAGSLSSIEVLIDRTSVEAFGNGGEVSVSQCCLFNTTGLNLSADSGAVRVSALSVVELNSIWTTSQP
ncbi:MAG: beta-fructosidase, levanase/invertase [Actinomycetia bacterium]|nr:beta-fructosidase, levanase/invertase [Actinomycetes bacterium]